MSEEVTVSVPRDLLLRVILTAEVDSQVCEAELARTQAHHDSFAREREDIARLKACAEGRAP